MTLADAKLSRIPQSIGACATDPRFIQILNEATQILLQEGLWWGAYARFRICADFGCITLPRGIATIESAAICGQPITMRSQWFEFLENGWGTRNTTTESSGPSGTDSCCGRNSWSWSRDAIYRGRFPTFSDVQGVDKRLRFVCDLASDVGKIVLALGYDENGNWIRTLQSGTWKDGELITLAQSPGTNSSKLFSGITDLQFPSTMNGQTWLYEYDTTLLTQRLIGAYQYDDTRPSFARYYFPSICPPSTTGCPTSQVEIMAKLDFIPVKNDTDYLLIGNLPALKRMCMAINRSEHEPDGRLSDQIMASGLASAKELLDKELLHYLGSGNVQPIRMPTPALSGGGVENILGNSYAW
jgi:hypothetical protein